jgi:hypothetical protein
VLSVVSSGNAYTIEPIYLHDLVVYRWKLSIAVHSFGAHRKATVVAYHVQPHYMHVSSSLTF